MKTCEVCGEELRDPEHDTQYPCYYCGKVTCDRCAWDIEEGDISRIVCVPCEDMRQAQWSARDPWPPLSVLLKGALQDRVHRDIGRGRPAMTIKVKKRLDDNVIS